MDMELNVSMKRLKQQMALPYLILMKQNEFVLWVGQVQFCCSKGFFLLKIYLIVCSTNSVSLFIVKSKLSGFNSIPIQLNLIFA
ncbi:hypothetical protein D3C72_1889560 [compost metagenome]